MPVTLQNVTRRMKVFHLDAVSLQTAGGEHGYRIVRPVVVVTTKKGKLGAVRKPRLVPSSITFCAGEVKHNLPDEILEAEQIKKATARGGPLRVVRQTPKEIEASAPANDAAKEEPKPKPKAVAPAPAPASEPKGDR